MKPFADIHCHLTLHPFAFHDSGRKNKNSLWSENKPKERQRNDKYPEYFQSNMPALTRGNVRLVVASLYPLEQPWFDPALTGTGSVTDLMASKLTVHVPVKYINKIQSRRNINGRRYLTHGAIICVTRMLLISLSRVELSVLIWIREFSQAWM